MHTNYLALPPDSTGKKINLIPMYVIGVADSSGLLIGDLVTGATSNASMHVIQIGTGRFYAQHTNKRQEGPGFSLNENILVGGVVKTTVNVAPTVIYVNSTVVVSFDNPSYGQRVDGQGQAYVRFEEGAQILDSVGRSKTSNEIQIGAYGFATHALWDEFTHHYQVGAGAMHVFNDTDGSMALYTGTPSGEEVILQTHKYHMHPKGQGLHASILLHVGDNGKTNVLREYGYFDDTNGVFFRLNGTDLCIVLYGSGSGSLIETCVPQSTWNKDKLDGTGISGVTLDVSKINRYWFDFHRGVRFRSGIYGNDGTRIVAHEFNIANTLPTLVMASTSLPIRVRQVNAGVSQSNSEIHMIEASVVIDGEMKKQTPFFETSGNIISGVDNTAWKPLVSIRPITTSKHTIALLVSSSISSVLSGTENDGRVKVEVFKNATLTGATWAGGTKPGSYFEIDKGATTMTGGKAISEHFCKGTKDFDMREFCSYLEEHLIQYIDDTQNIYTLAVKAISAPCDCVGALNWEEYQY